MEVKEAEGMYAIIETGGKQYRVIEGKPLLCEKLPGEPGATVNFEKVLLVASREKGGTPPHVGTPYLAKATVTGKIVEHLRGKKVLVFKYKPKKRYRKKQGHRQELTRVLVESISVK